MSGVTVSQSAVSALQARQDAAEMRNHETTNRAAGRSSGVADNPAVFLSTSTLAEKAGDLNMRLDEMARAADASAKEAFARESRLSDEDMALRAAEAAKAEETAVRNEEAARALAEQASVQLAQDKLSMTTRADRNVLQYLTG